MFDRTFKHFSASPEELIKNKFQDTFFFNKLGTLGNLLYLCTREEPPSPFIFDSNRASEPIEITAKFNGGLRYAPPKNINYDRKKMSAMRRAYGKE